MDIAEIVREIDKQIDTLKRVRALLAGDKSPAPRKRNKKRRAKKTFMPLPVHKVPAEPRVVKLPPKVKREYRSRVRTIAPVSALTAAPFDKPVFVPKNNQSEFIKRASKPSVADMKVLEETVRQMLFNKAN